MIQQTLLRVSRLKLTCCSHTETADSFIYSVASIIRRQITLCGCRYVEFMCPVIHRCASVPPDETQFRNCIVWLEDQKIRHYKIEDRGDLRNIPSSEWPKAYQKYLQDVNCPFGVQEKQEAVDWLLGLAVRYEYGDNGKKMKSNYHLFNSDKAIDPLVNLDSNSPDFKAGVTALSNILKIQRHDDYLVMLKRLLVWLQPHSCVFSSPLQGIPVALDKHILGFDTGDATLNEAAQILRLLHIEELRELQTKINEAIVAVQAIIADPKTDHRLGKVGR
uniref:RNA transcription, translation and transport factor protein n=1 Tax=Seriola dumerili TaxID=41447 RepID=A0A3B4U7E9_SERDU